MNKTITPSLETIERNWFLVDAKDKTLGRLATEIATVLRGKNKPTFTPHLDTGDFVIVVNAEKVEMLQSADHIYIEALKSEGLYDSIWQAGVILLPVKSVGVMGDERTYENCVVLRAVTSTDGMTADWVDIPYKFLQNVSNKIINSVKGINRVVYDISSKPPSTIEWE